MRSFLSSWNKLAFLTQKGQQCIYSGVIVLSCLAFGSKRAVLRASPIPPTDPTARGSYISSVAAQRSGLKQALPASLDDTYLAWALGVELVASAQALGASQRRTPTPTPPDRGNGRLKDLIKDPEDPPKPDPTTGEWLAGSSAHLHLWWDMRTNVMH